MVITYHLLILFVGPKRRSYGTETVINVPVSVPGPIGLRNGTETGTHRHNNSFLGSTPGVPSVVDNLCFRMSSSTCIFMPVYTVGPKAECRLDCQK